MATPATMYSTTKYFILAVKPVKNGDYRLKTFYYARMFNICLPSSVTPTPRTSPVAHHPAPITIRQSPVTALLAPFPCHPSSIIRLVWPIEFVFYASKSAMDARDWFDNIWRQIFNQSSSLHCCVTFTFWWLPDPLKPPYYTITR